MLKFDLLMDSKINDYPKFLSGESISQKVEFLIYISEKGVSAILIACPIMIICWIFNRVS